MRVRTYHDFDDLPASAEGLFGVAEQGDLLHSRAWLRAATDASVRPGDRLVLYTVDDGDAAASTALLQSVYSRLYAAHPNSRVLHFLRPEETCYEPLLRAAAEDVGAVTDAIVDALRGDPKSYDVIRASPLPEDSVFTHALIAALRRTRHPLQVYRHSIDHYESVAGLSFKDYLAARPRALRETLERNNRLLMQGGRGRFNYPCTRELLASAWDDIARVIAAAPVEGQDDPPGYIPAIMAAAADAGALRLGVFQLDDVAVAAQFWVVSGGVAHCLRIWSAQGQRAFPVDEMLTQMMALCLIDGDRVSELDFGNIVPEFAADWTTQTRNRIGLAAFNPRTWRGMRGALRHVGVQRIRALPGRALRALGLRR